MDNYTTIDEIHKLFLKHPRVFNDTRKAVKDSIFIAVSSDNRMNKGNHYAEEAIKNGSSYAIIDDVELKKKHFNDPRYILVENGNITLQKLGQFHRKYLNIPIIAIAGSNGKTTTKELVKAVLSQKYKVECTPGNLNNQFGVPLSLLNFNEQHEIGILELGANHLEETYNLCKICTPDFGIVTNCGKDHLEGYGTVENVIRANSELYEWLGQNNGVAFVNADDLDLLNNSGNVLSRVFYGLKKSNNSPEIRVVGKLIRGPWVLCEVYIPNEEYHLKFKIQSRLFGSFWLSSILAAITIGNYFGVSSELIRQAIESYDPGGRLRSELYNWNGSKVLLDCYNANPSSMSAFIDSILTLEQSKNKVLVLGSMLEGGKNSVNEHFDILNKIAGYRDVQVILVGNSKNNDFELALERIDEAGNFKYFKDATDAKEYIISQHSEENYYFVKGSRSVFLETIFDYIKI